MPPHSKAADLKTLDFPAATEFLLATSSEMVLHFSVPNHGRLWKSLMRAYLGDYERLELRLQKASPLQRGHLESQ